MKGGTGSTALAAVLLTVVGTLSACSGSGEAASSGAAAAATPDPAASGEAEADGSTTVAASRFQIVYRLDGAVARSDAVGVDLPIALAFRPAVESGAQVQAGAQLGDLVLPAATPAAGTVEESRRKLAEGRAGSVTAPLAGTAEVSPSAVQIARPGLDVVVPLTALQELRYRGVPFTGAASVETVLGQRQVPCQAVWLGPADPSRAPDTSEGADAVASTSSVHCRLPDSAETAPGLPATLTLTSPERNDVIVVPLVYIGQDQQGNNYVVSVRSGDGVVERPVVVGATDGVRRVVVSGLAPGDVLLPLETP